MGRLEADEQTAELHSDQVKKERLRALGKTRQVNGTSQNATAQAHHHHHHHQHHRHAHNATKPEPETAEHDAPPEPEAAEHGAPHHAQDSDDANAATSGRHIPFGVGAPTVAPDAPEVHAPTDRTPPLEEDDGVDPALVKDGWCEPFAEGALIRGTGEQVTRWKDLTRADCWSKCNLDPACSQAIYEIDDSNGDTHCWIGTSFMTEATLVLSHRCETCRDACYAKHGFGVDKVRHVKPGFCSDFVEGYAIGESVQCQLESTSTDDQTHCSHWGQEYDLSEIGCWTKCESHANCGQAIYDNATANCWIGTANMTQNPGPNQCATCINSCYAKHGFP